MSLCQDFSFHDMQHAAPRPFVARETLTPDIEKVSLNNKHRLRSSDVHPNCLDVGTTGLFFGPRLSFARGIAEPWIRGISSVNGGSGLF